MDLMSSVHTQGLHVPYVYYAQRHIEQVLCNCTLFWGEIVNGGPDVQCAQAGSECTICSMYTDISGISPVIVNYLGSKS